MYDSLMEIEKLLRAGKSQAAIARELGITRQAVHIAKNQLIDSGTISPEAIVKYPKREKREFINEILLIENEALFQKYIKMYKDGATLADIIKEARTDGIKSPSRAAIEALETEGCRCKERRIRDAETDKLLLEIFKDKKFYWTNKGLVLLAEDEKVPKLSATKDQPIPIRDLYDEFSKYATIKYITWSKWMETTGETYKVAGTKRGIIYIQPTKFITFLNKKFGLDEKPQIEVEEPQVEVNVIKKTIKTNGEETDESNEPTKIASNG